MRWALLALALAGCAATGSRETPAREASEAGPPPRSVPPRVIEDLFVDLGYEVWHNAIIPSTRVRPGVSPEHASRELVAHLRGDPGALPTELSFRGDVHEDPASTSTVRARDFWAMTLSHITSKSLALGVRDSVQERQDRIAELLDRCAHR